VELSVLIFGFLLVGLVGFYSNRFNCMSIRTDINIFSTVCPHIQTKTRNVT
jgi:hypothetical protein